MKTGNNNSGLGVGELNKVKLTADDNRANADTSLAAALNDISRRVALANNGASNDRASLAKWKATQMAGAEANAFIDADNTNYSRGQDAVKNDQWQQGFDLQKSQAAADNAYRDKVFDNTVSQQNQEQSNWQKSFDNTVSQQNQQQSNWDKSFLSSEQQRDYENQMNTAKFEYQKTQDDIQNKLANRQMNNQDAQLELQKAKQKFDETQTGIDNAFREKSFEYQKTKDAADRDVEYAKIKASIAKASSGSGKLTTAQKSQIQSTYTSKLLAAMQNNDYTTAETMVYGDRDGIINDLGQKYYDSLDKLFTAWTAPYDPYNNAMDQLKSAVKQGIDDPNTIRFINGQKVAVPY
jgi:hypothetical protein